MKDPEEKSPISAFSDFVKSCEDPVTMSGVEFVTMLTDIDSGKLDPRKQTSELLRDLRASRKRPKSKSN